MPRPGSLTIWIAPRCSSMIRWQSARPRPSPLSLVVKNGVKSRERVASGMPWPSSSTWISAMLRWPCPTSTLAKSGFMLSRVTRVRRPPAVIASTALRTRLWKTCRMRSSSARIGGQARVVAPHDLHPVLGRHLLGQERHALEELVQVERDQTQGDRPADVEQHLDDPVDPVHLLEEHVGVLGEARVLAQLAGA